LDVEHRVAIATRHGKVVLMKNGAVTSTIHLEVTALSPPRQQNTDETTRKYQKSNGIVKAVWPSSLSGSQVAPCHAVEAPAAHCCEKEDRYATAHTKMSKAECVLFSNHDGSLLRQ